MKQMKTMQFNLSDFNPDCMTESEMEQWCAFIGAGQRPQCAKQWFPGMKGQFRAARYMRHYLFNKMTAMRCRLDGKIETALQYERICDRIYNDDLPESAKW